MPIVQERKKVYVYTIWLLQSTTIQHASEIHCHSLVPLLKIQYYYSLVVCAVELNSKKSHRLSDFLKHFFDLFSSRVNKNTTLHFSPFNDLCDQIKNGWMTHNFLLICLYSSVLYSNPNPTTSIWEYQMLFNWLSHSK
jgi:hypothetical protein